MEEVLVPKNESLTACASPAEYHAKVDALLAAIQDSGAEQVDLSLRHIFVPGMYAREGDIPAGTLCISKIHKTEHLCVISKGSASVLTENGVVRLTAPHTMITKPGTRRVVYIHEDSTWTTFHATNKTNLEDIEKDIIAPTYGDLISLRQEALTLAEAVCG